MTWTVPLTRQICCCRRPDGCSYCSPSISLPDLPGRIWRPLESGGLKGQCHIGRRCKFNESRWHACARAYIGKHTEGGGGSLPLFLTRNILSKWISCTHMAAPIINVVKWKWMSCTANKNNHVGGFNLHLWQDFVIEQLTKRKSFPPFILVPVQSERKSESDSDGYFWCRDIQQVPKRARRGQDISARPGRQ